MLGAIRMRLFGRFRACAATIVRGRSVVSKGKRDARRAAPELAGNHDEPSSAASA
jgi:hypothetical protein